MKMPGKQTAAAEDKSQVAAPAAIPSGSETAEAPSPGPTPKGSTLPETRSSPPVGKGEKPASTETGPDAVNKAAMDSSFVENGNGEASLRALVELSESEQVTAAEALLRRQGFAVDRLRSWKEQSVEIQQGRYSLIFTHQSDSPKTVGVQSFIQGLAPEARREIFLVLVGDEFKTADGTQAFSAQADLVCRPDELGDADTVLRATIAEKHRLYRTYLEAQSKREAGRL